MKKTKLEERFEKAVNAFFENEISSEPTALAVAENHEIAQVSLTESLGQTADKYYGWFKKLFLFLPGVNILYFVGFFSAFILTCETKLFPLNIGMFFWLLVGVFMTLVGIGDWRKKEHLAIPASVISVGAIVGTICGLIELIYPQFSKLLFSDTIPLFLYLMPLAFIAPILTKNWLDKEE